MLNMVDIVPAKPKNRYPPNNQAIKIDALWKPIIRKFRQFIKKLVLDELQFQFYESEGEA